MVKGPSNLIRTSGGPNLDKRRQHPFFEGTDATYLLCRHCSFWDTFP
jgi:hypothetical protein